jgi:hypothetical protein
LKLRKVSESLFTNTALLSTYFLLNIIYSNNEYPPAISKNINIKRAIFFFIKNLYKFLESLAKKS